MGGDKSTSSLLRKRCAPEQRDNVAKGVQDAKSNVVASCVRLRWGSAAQAMVWRRRNARLLFRHATLRRTNNHKRGAERDQHADAKASAKGSDALLQRQRRQAARVDAHGRLRRVAAENAAAAGAVARRAGAHQRFKVQRHGRVVAHRREAGEGLDGGCGTVRVGNRWRQRNRNWERCSDSARAPQTASRNERGKCAQR